MGEKGIGKDRGAGVRCGGGRRKINQEGSRARRVKRKPNKTASDKVSDEPRTLKRVETLFVLRNKNFIVIIMKIILLSSVHYIYTYYLIP